jgi:hypothetical protein
MRVVVQHYPDPEETVTTIPGKVLAHIEMEDGSEESTDPVDVRLGQQLTYTVSAGAGQEAYLDDTQIQAVIDSPPPVPTQEPITPDEAKALHAVWAGDAFDAEHLESVQPKLEAIAGESWR